MEIYLFAKKRGEEEILLLSSPSESLVDSMALKALNRYQSVILRVKKDNHLETFRVYSRDD